MQSQDALQNNALIFLKLCCSIQKMINIEKCLTFIILQLREKFQVSEILQLTENFQLR